MGKNVEIPFETFKTCLRKIGTGLENSDNEAAKALAVLHLDTLKSFFPTPTLEEIHEHIRAYHTGGPCSLGMNACVAAIREMTNLDSKDAYNYYDKLRDEEAKKEEEARQKREDALGDFDFESPLLL